jgi:hypothetical protein
LRWFARVKSKIQPLNNNSLNAKRSWTLGRKRWMKGRKLWPHERTWSGSRGFLRCPESLRPNLSGPFRLNSKASLQIPLREELTENNECRSASLKGSGGWKRYKE